MCLLQSSGSLSLLEREKRLGDQLKELTGQRVERLQKLKSLKDEEQKLCSILTEQPTDVDVSAVPSTKQLAQIQENILRLECEKVHHANAV